MAFRSQTALPAERYPGRKSPGLNHHYRTRSALGYCGDGHAVALGSLTRKSWGGGFLEPGRRGWYWAPAFRIAGGTDEILRKHPRRACTRDCRQNIGSIVIFPFNRSTRQKSTHSGGARGQPGTGLEKSMNSTFRPSKSISRPDSPFPSKGRRRGSSAQRLDHKVQNYSAPDLARTGRPGRAGDAPSPKNTPDWPRRSRG